MTENEPINYESGRLASPTDEAARAETGREINMADKSHPGAHVEADEITGRDQHWRDIGSGIVARTFRKAKRLHTTSKGGPCADDVYSRKVWSLSTGKLLDECIVDDVADARLHRELKEPDDIRVELTLKNAIALYERKGPDIVEIDSQPRV